MHVIGSRVAHSLSNKGSLLALSLCLVCDRTATESLPVSERYDNTFATYSRAGSGVASSPGPRWDQHRHAGICDPALALAVEFENASAYIFSNTSSMGKF